MNNKEWLAHEIMFSVSDANRDMINAERMTEKEKSILKTPFEEIDKLSAKNQSFWMSYNHERYRYRKVVDRLVSQGINFA